MKRIFLVFIMLLFAACAHGGSQGAVAGEAGGMPEWGMAAEKAHPRLLMADADMKMLRKNIRRNRDIRLLHQSLLAHADFCVDDTLQITYTFDASGRRILDQSRYALERIFFCAYAWRMTGKDKYLAQVEEDILTICAFPDWNTKHFLDTAEMALAVALGLDWCYCGLPASVRDEAAATLELLALSKFRGQWFASQKTNWNQVCYCGLAAAAIAVYERYPELCSELLTAAVTDNKKAMEMYGPDGAYPEGYVYWSYGTGFETMLLEMLTETFGTDAGLSESPGFMHTGDFMKYLVGTSGKTFNYYDSDEETWPLYAMWWFAARLSRPDLLLSEIALLREGKYLEEGDGKRFAVFAACMASKFALPRKIIPATGAALWSGDGLNPVVLIRTGWDGSPDGRYLAFKGGKARNNHGHMDSGSFVFDAFGLRWACDLGTQEYAPMENSITARGGNLWNMSQGSLRWDVFRFSNFAHNTLTVNSQKHYAKGDARIVEIIDTDKAKGGIIDMTPVFPGQLDSASRKIMLLDSDSLLVSDYVAALSDAPADIEWRMVTDATATVTENGILLEQGGYSMLLSAASNDPAIRPAYRIWPAVGPGEWDDPNPGKSIVGYSLTLPAGASCTVTVSLRPL
ncbi:MAG: heparinase II/III family protein [Bacteroidales bacterium]|nr:heparinase II/III family protein [Bacteroidales bacterium]